MVRTTRTNKKKNRLLKVAGLDPSMSNWGICIGMLDAFNGEFEVTEVHVIQPNKFKSEKKMRQNTKDVLLAQDLYKSNMAILTDIDILFAELPIGSQSARAMASYGICLGIIGALNENLTEIIQVTPQAVKKVVGNDNPSKEEMIDWAIEQHPEIDFPKYKSKGMWYISNAKAEHMADALVAIYAGARTAQFETLIKSIQESLK